MHRLISIICLGLVLTACTGMGPASPVHVTPSLAYLRLSADGSAELVVRPDPQSAAASFPLEIPSGCSLYRLTPSPVAALLAVEFQCEAGPRVDFYDSQTGQRLSSGWTRPAAAHFLAWSLDGRFLYLKAGGVNAPQILRLQDRPEASIEVLKLPSSVYDLAALPNGDILYSTTAGIGFGSEVWRARADGRSPLRVLAQPLDIVAYLRPSPDGNSVAFVRFPDTQTPFPDGELWIMDARGRNAHALAEADAGHGFAPAWNPDGTQLVYVVRANPDDPAVEGSAAALRSNLERLEVKSGLRSPVTTWADAQVGSPAWSPDGTTLVFPADINDTIKVWYERSGTLRPLDDTSSCCAVWVPGK